MYAHYIAIHPSAAFGWRVHKKTREIDEVDGKNWMAVEKQKKY